MTPGPVPLLRVAPPLLPCFLSHSSAVLSIIKPEKAKKKKKRVNTKAGPSAVLTTLLLPHPFTPLLIRVCVSFPFPPMLGKGSYVCAYVCSSLCAAVPLLCKDAPRLASSLITRPSSSKVRSANGSSITSLRVNYLLAIVVYFDLLVFAFIDLSADL